ncbi:hypothetical protein ACP4OV_019971 [Aristida adscensionis]
MKTQSQRHTLRSELEWRQPRQPWKQPKAQIYYNLFSKPQSLSSSCSSTCPSQLRKDREIWDSHINGRKRKNNIWWNYLKMQGFFEDDAATKLNERFGGADGYVPLNATKVGVKIKECRKRFRGSKELGPAATSFYAQFGPAGTSSVSVGGKKEKPTCPFDSYSALEYLNGHGCPNIDLYKYAIPLKNETVVKLFNLKEAYEERIKLLNDLLNVWGASKAAVMSSS